MQRLMKRIAISLLPTLAFGVAGAQDGAQVYQSNCAQCHGDQGGGGAGPALAGNQSLENTRMVVNQILHGGGGMPAFADQLSAEQLAAVATHIRTSWANSFGGVSVQEVQRIKGSRQLQQDQSQQEQQTGGVRTNADSGGVAQEQEGQSQRMTGGAAAGAATEQAQQQAQQKQQASRAVTGGGQTETGGGAQVARDASTREVGQTGLEDVDERVNTEEVAGPPPPRTEDADGVPGEPASLTLQVTPEGAEVHLGGPPGLEPQTLPGGEQVLEGLPAGGYTVVVHYEGRSYRQTLWLEPGGSAEVAFLLTTGE
jgi:cytochrome c553